MRIYIFPSLQLHRRDYLSPAYVLYRFLFTIPVPWRWRRTIRVKPNLKPFVNAVELDDIEAGRISNGTEHFRCG